MVVSWVLVALVSLCGALLLSLQITKADSYWGGHSVPGQLLIGAGALVFAVTHALISSRFPDNTWAYALAGSLLVATGVLLEFRAMRQYADAQNAADRQGH